MDGRGVEADASQGGGAEKIDVLCSSISAVGSRASGKRKSDGEAPSTSVDSISMCGFVISFTGWLLPLVPSLRLSSANKARKRNALNKTHFPFSTDAVENAMTSAPRIFDRPLQRRRLERALTGGYTDFLLSRVVEDLADRLAAVKRRFPQAVDIATPTPAAALALASSGMVDRVVRLAHVASPSAMADAVADEEALPLAPGQFDLAVSVMALHHVNDLPGALVQIRRALKPDGLFLAAFLGGETLTELRQAFTQAQTQLEGGVSPRVAPFADLRELGGLLQRAGFALPVADVDRVTVRYGDPLALMRDLRGMGLTNSLHERSRLPLRRATLIGACEAYMERFAAPDGRVPATFDVLWLSGWVPHESQQKPMRPGSAQTKLVDVLPDRSKVR